MSKEYFEKLTQLIAKLGSFEGFEGHLAVKHFFSGAALYVKGDICASLTPVGLAFKLPEAEVADLIQSGWAKPLNYFPKGPLKKGYALFENPDLSQGQIWRPYFKDALQQNSNRKEPKLSTLNDQTLLECISYLCDMDIDLRNVILEFGHPPLWAREPGFPTLIHIILEQQVSLASAKAAFNKLEQTAGELTPQRFLEFSDIELREVGFSRQKARYGRGLSEAIILGDLDLGGLQSLDDKTARADLAKIKGIGPWTADIYLLMALMRPDIWPSGDLALAKALQEIKGLADKPNPERLNEIAEQWKPCRAVAARILWHYYLNRVK